MVFKYITRIKENRKRKLEARERTLQECRATHVGKLEEEVLSYEKEVNRIEPIEPPKGDEIMNNDTISKFYNSVFGEKRAPYLIDLHNESNWESQDGEFITSIFESQKNVKVSALKGRIDDLTIASTNLKNSKNPEKDVRKLREYFKEYGEYSQAIGRAGGCGFGYGESPKKPKILAQ